MYMLNLSLPPTHIMECGAEFTSSGAEIIEKMPNDISGRFDWNICTFDALYLQKAGKVVGVSGTPDFEFKFSR